MPHSAYDNDSMFACLGYSQEQIDALYSKGCILRTDLDK